MATRDEEKAASRDSLAPRSGLRLMALIVLVFAAVAIFSNYQKAHIRDYEQVTVAPAPSPVAAPTRAASENEP